MTKINIQGPGGASLPTGNLQVDNPLDNTLQVVKDTAGTGSPLELSTDLVSVASTLQIATDDTIYIDAEDSLGNNRFTVSRTVGQQNVNIDFASNPTLSTKVGAIRTFKDGVSLSDALSFEKNGQANFSAKARITSTEQCLLEIVNDTSGAGISFKDSTTLDLLQVGVGAFGDLLCLRGGGNVAGTVQIGNAFVNVRGNQLRNFVPIINSEAVGLTIDSTNQDSYCAGVLEVTGAITVTIDDSVRDGFSISVIQMDANQCTFLAGGTLTLQNRQGHTQTAGQWATVTLFKNGTNLILAGDTV